jgi:hypothetical protein
VPLVGDQAAAAHGLANTHSGEMAAILDTTVGYLLGESTEGKTLKDTAMLKRLNDISALPDKDKEHILYTIDGLIKSAKLQTL